MCGIFCLLGEYNKEKTLEYFGNIKYRGPDDSLIKEFRNIFLGFHRLAIVDLSEGANQPLKHKDKDIWLICNGEIYNHKKLLEDLNVVPLSDSDCEAILYCYDAYGIEETCNKLDGVFAFILYDQDKDLIYTARDPFGVRPLFKGESGSIITFTSEMKAIPNDYNIEHILPGTYNIVTNTMEISSHRYYEYVYPPQFHFSIYDNLTDKINEAINKRLMSDRPIGCLLSGGLDSSLIAAIASKKIKELSKDTKKLHTFSIGLEGGTDLIAAQIVANHIDSIHTQVIKTKEEFLEAIPDVIYTIESYDITTVRASVGHYLLAKYIKENTDITVLLGGEGADEIMGGYLYFQHAPTTTDFNNECINLLQNIHKYDVLRADRCISSRWGLEARVPFLDKKFVADYLGIDIGLRVGGKKELIRSIFRDSDLLPPSILERPKEAFSDGVSSFKDSWYVTIQKYLDTKIDDKDIVEGQTKEEYYYLSLFKDYFGDKNVDIIPYLWRPKWTTVTDPSARLL